MTGKARNNCCALAHMSASSDTTVEEIQTFIENAKKESERYKDRIALPIWGGERALFCVTTPKEQQLEKNLMATGFKHIYSFERRYCYEPGTLKMWMNSW